MRVSVLHQYDIWLLRRDLMSALTRINDFCVGWVVGDDAISEDSPEWLRGWLAGIPYPVISANRNECISSCEMLSFLYISLKIVTCPQIIAKLHHIKLYENFSILFRLLHAHERTGRCGEARRLFFANFISDRSQKGHKILVQFKMIIAALKMMADKK
jgi:hypothetical protein